MLIIIKTENVPLKVGALTMAGRIATEEHVDEFQGGLKPITITLRQTNPYIKPTDEDLFGDRHDYYVSALRNYEYFESTIKEFPVTEYLADDLLKKYKSGKREVLCGFDFVIAKDAQENSIACLLSEI